MQSDIGLIGLAVMGQNLALNMERNGFAVSVYNRSRERTEAFINGTARGKRIIPVYDMQSLIASLKRPRVLMLMVKAGAPVDAVIDEALPCLEQGDVLIDGGNSFFKDTQRRFKRVGAAGIEYIGAGVSGGEEGALNGPSIMPGGSPEGYAAVKGILESIAAQAEGGPCCTYIGADGAGHFVKTTHNGIEYGDMQLIAESAALLRGAVGLSAEECADVFAQWNETELDSYLIDITSRIFKKRDDITGAPLVDVILDCAGQKGTGMWTSQQALELGTPAPLITEAVYARYLSALKGQRERAASALGAAAQPAGMAGDKRQYIDAIRDALYAAKICSYAQGFALLRDASAQYGWSLDMGSIALIWRGGCIIRARFLGRIKEAYDRAPGLENLLLDPFFTQIMQKNDGAFRRVVALAAQTGVAAPCFMSALAYYDGMRSARSSAYLLQAQRDYFGAHTYKRVDMDGDFHTEWMENT